MIADIPALITYPNVVSKLFTDKELFDRELKVYKLAPPHVPDLLSAGEAEIMGPKLYYITAKRIKGKAYLDLPNFSTSELGSALADFHAFTYKAEKCLCHIDNQPQNILLAGSKYYFIDFSDSRYDFPEVDITHLLLFWAEEYRYLDFIARAGSLLNRYQEDITLERSRWSRSLKESIIRFDERRAKYHKSPVRSEDSSRNRDWLSAVI
ncbi:MAG: phosphotransferase [Candidatus Cloacimonetes bacterium]|nr:phosphotransferase [Candidatus Cloacimonadota bacterium]MCB5286221.1 phosphotransferase [Candidatus Cloacimonadota bacterium]MCK9183904.1 phosphotransferase [Candidatus Cloacimonadota bacterium]MCK9584670.1 phosphotransferase [Candidatus Cloacimonadota bacterium]MDY0228543.1 phosphotransferase [Candidatus Cloacimonadaceae bacterium]